MVACTCECWSFAMTIETVTYIQYWFEIADSYGNVDIHTRVFNPIMNEPMPR